MVSPLKKWRESLGITQAGLAALSGVNRTHISDVENGHAPITGKLEEFLKKTGDDSIKIIAQQDKFIEFVKMQLQEKLECEG